MRCVIPQIAWHTREPVLSLDFDPSCKNEDFYRLASGGGDNLLLIWHIKDSQTIKPLVQCVAELKRHLKAINVVRFSPDGSLLASGDDDGYILLWKPEKNSEQENESWTFEKSLRRHVEDVSDLNWSSDGAFLVSGSVDNSAVLWDVKKGSPLQIWSEHNGFVHGVAYDPLGEFCATMCIDRSLRFFNIKTGKLANRVFKYPPSWVKNNKKLVDTVESELPSTPTPAVKAEEKENNPENGAETPNKKPANPQGPLNRMFHDESLKTFCRRLSFSPKGEFLAVPAAILPQPETTKDKNVLESPVKKEIEDVKPPVVSENKNKQNSNHAVAFFCRNSFTNPCALVSLGTSYAVACKFCPVYYNRKRETFTYDADFSNPIKKSERSISCVGKIKPSRKERQVMMNTSYRLLYAIATNDSVIIGDTTSAAPMCTIQNIHCTRLTDIAWSPDGLLLLSSSTDGYVSIVSFAENELGTRYQAGSPEPPNPECYPILPPKPKPVKKKEPKTPVATPVAAKTVTPTSTTQAAVLTSASAATNGTPKKPKSAKRIKPIPLPKTDDSQKTPIEATQPLAPAAATPTQVLTTPPKPKPKNTLDRWLVKTKTPTDKKSETPIVHQSKKIKLEKDLRIVIEPLEKACKKLVATSETPSVNQSSNSDSNDVQIVYEKPLSNGLNPKEMFKLATAPVKNDGVNPPQEAQYKSPVPTEPMEVDDVPKSNTVFSKEVATSSSVVTNSSKAVKTPEKQTKNETTIPGPSAGPISQTEPEVSSTTSNNLNSPVASTSRQPRRVQLITLPNPKNAREGNTATPEKGNLD